MQETYEAKYGNTVYVIKRSFSAEATETVNDKIKRLILKDLDRMLAEQQAA